MNNRKSGFVSGGAQLFLLSFSYNYDCKSKLFEKKISQKNIGRHVWTFLNEILENELILNNLL